MIEISEPICTPPIVAIVGPTATGKSDLAVELARQCGGEIINADSMQLYVGMDIGTAKLPLDARGDVAHHLLDVWPITKSAAVAEYQTLARNRIDEIQGRGHIAILVGGSGLYLRGVLDNLEFPGESAPIRARLTALAEEVGLVALHARLGELDPAAAAAILPSNGRRIVRALEVIELTGQPFTARMPDFSYLRPTVQIGLDRDDLDERVEVRVQRMVADVGDLAEALAITVRATRRFVRRQRSWFRRDPRIRWLEAQDRDLLRQAERMICTEPV
jgi:tRNA dimethylallyltransferase